MPDYRPESECVVLVNGLWLGDPALWLLARRLRQAGFQTFSFSYPSVRQDLRVNAAQLHEFLARVPGATVHLIGYSLGGLVIRALFRFHPGQRPGRVVLLGSPQQGSRAAMTLSASAFGRRLIGRSLADLNAGTPQAWDWPAREIGAIAGSLPFGLGRLVGRLSGPNDGTVLVSEAVPAVAHDRLVLRVSHAGLLFMPAVARQAAAFLRSGRFAR
jgi:pimeloyl-ACP methyl ester carboxylesterase